MCNSTRGLIYEPADVFIQLYRQGFAVAQRMNPETQQKSTVSYESTGMRGRSTLREVDIATGRVLRQVSLEDELFGPSDGA